MTASLMVRETPHHRMRTVGVRSLSSSELIAILAGVNVRTAHEVLALCNGSLKCIASKPVAGLNAVTGIAKGRAHRIHAALELGRRMAAEDRGEGFMIRGPRDIWEFCRHTMEDLPVEEFHVLILDSQHRMQRDVTITRGLLNSALVHPREVFREAIAENAAAIVLVHNHPSGDTAPSPDDRVTTEALYQAGKVLDIPVQDHIIIGRNRYLSFAEAGLL
jgi:DNA repair protein RadC